MGRSIGRLRYLAAVLSGLFLACGFPGIQIPLLGWLALTLLIAAVARTPPRPAFLLGFLSGIVFHGLTLGWIYTVMREHGFVPPLPAAAIVALVVVAASVFPAFFGLGFASMSRAGGLTRACLAAPFLWVALEFARAKLPIIGFPWNLSGYIAANSLVLLQLAPWAGIWLLCLLVASYGALVAWAVATSKKILSRPLAIGLAATLLLVTAAKLGAGFIPVGAPRHVARLVQTNFPEASSYPTNWMEVHAAEMDELERISVSTNSARPALIVWPEVPAPFHMQDPQFVARAERIARSASFGLLAGVVDWKPRADLRTSGTPAGLAPYNSAALFDAAGRPVFLYDKIHLVPFGEYVPFRRWLRFAEKLTAEVGDFQPGSEYKVGKLRSGSFGAFICYEAVFPGEVRQFSAQGAELLINISNDGWFGRSAAPEQHLMMARVRAVENRRWMLRDTNNGYTVSVDPYGRFVARMPVDVRGALDAPFDFRSDLTPYARWGDWLPWLAVVVSAASIVTLGCTHPMPGLEKSRSKTEPSKPASRFHLRSSS